jgi:ABC-type ATPase involved in cell division
LPKLKCFRELENKKVKSVSVIKIKRKEKKIKNGKISRRRLSTKVTKKHRRQICGIITDKRQLRKIRVTKDVSFKIAVCAGKENDRKQRI